MSTLAIYGGTPAVPAGTIKPWPPIDRVDEERVMASLRGTAHAFGPNCQALQKEFAAWNGNRYCITTNSGTAALHMGVAACGVGAGDHVLVTAYSWSASATCILHHCAIPVFVDIDFETMNMDLDKLEAAITPRTKAILAVHLHGLALDMDRLLAIARKHKLAVIEDACQSHGAQYRGRNVGTFGDCAAFSFSQNKTLGSGEGGLFVTDDETKAIKARQLWSFGEVKAPGEDRDYHAHMIGWMYRNNDLTAAFGRAQLSKLDSYLHVQQDNARAFHERVKGLAGKGLILPVEPPGFTHSWYEYVVRLDLRAIGWTGDPAVFRDAVVRALQAEGAPAVLWQRLILPAMTVFRRKNAFGHGVPWSVDNAGAGVEYVPEQYPQALRHAQTHLGLNQPLRVPNGPEAVARLADAYHKVFENVARIDPEKIQRICQEQQVRNQARATAQAQAQAQAQALAELRVQAQARAEARARPAAGR